MSSSKRHQHVYDSHPPRLTEPPNSPTTDPPLSAARQGDVLNPTSRLNLTAQKMVVFIPEGACINCYFLRRDGEHGTEYRKVQCRHLLIELFRQEVDVVYASRSFLPTPQQTKLRQRLFREGTRHQEEIRCIGRGMAVSRRNDGQWRNPLGSRLKPARSHRVQRSTGKTQQSSVA